MLVPRKASLLCRASARRLATLLLFPLLPLAAPLASAQVLQSAAPAYDFYGHGPYRSRVPRPSAVLGYEIGRTHSTFRDQERVLLALAAAAPDRVRIVEYGTSVEGRPLRLIFVSAPDNLKRLEAIRAETGKLADPRTLTDSAESDRIVANTPTLTWINHCIHGDETASFETVMLTLYTLAASDAPEIVETLKKSVVILNPVFNPDGHERFVVNYNSIAVGSPEGFALEKETPWNAVGRFNHYRFDMNRDKMAQSQPETRQETAAFLRWHPQVFVDQHGQPQIYFFPPNAQSVHRQTDRTRVEKWTSLFGRANSVAFDRYGWQYVTREEFDLFAPIYLDSWTSLTGAIGMTYETDGGGNLARRRDDDTISTLKDAAAHHFESALATIVAAGRNRESLLRDYLAYHRDAIEAGRTDRMRRIVILPGSDPGRAGELAGLLRRVGIEVRQTSAPLRSAVSHAYFDTPKSAAAVEKTFPVGALIVDLAQPQGRMARAFLEPETDFEPEFMKEQLARRDRNGKKNDNERKEGYGFYDTTAWALPFAYGLDAYWTEDAPDVPARALELDARGNAKLDGAAGGVSGGQARVAYLIPYDREAAVLMALRLLQEGYHVAVVTRPVRAENREWARGTFVVRVSRNPVSLHARIEALAHELGVPVVAAGSGFGEAGSGGLGSESIEDVKRPSIAVAGGDGVDQTAFGAVWHLLEKQVGLKFTSISLRALPNADLSRFNVILLPEGRYGSLGKRGADVLKEWASRGGALIGLGDAGVWFADKEIGLTTASKVEPEPKKDDKPGSKPAVPAVKPAQPLSLPGAIFRATIDTTHFLGFGYGTGETAEIAAPLSGDIFLKPSEKGSNVVTFGKENLRLSGFVWPDNTEKFLANTSYVIDEPTGRGHILLFLADPTARATWIGLRRMLLNGIAFGPGRAALTPIGAIE
jgi:hypothetical protein